MDQDRRWQLVRKLNQFQFGSYENLLNAEIKRDSSDKGNKNAIAAQVVRPDIENKKKWLDIVINHPEKYKLSTASYILGALFPGSQANLHAKFSTQILAAMPSLNTKAQQAYVSSFSGNLAPGLCNEQSVVSLEKANQTFKSLNPSVVKAFLRAHQEDQRCVNILNRIKNG